MYDLSYDLKWNNSGKDLDCRTKCRARVMLSMNLYVCRLGVLFCLSCSPICFLSYEMSHGDCTEYGIVERFAGLQKLHTRDIGVYEV